MKDSTAVSTAVAPAKAAPTVPHSPPSTRPQPTAKELAAAVRRSSLRSASKKLFPPPHPLRVTFPTLAPSKPALITVADEVWTTGRKRVITVNPTNEDGSPDTTNTPPTTTCTNPPPRLISHVPPCPVFLWCCVDTTRLNSDDYMAHMVTHAVWRIQSKEYSDPDEMVDWLCDLHGDLGADADGYNVYDEEDDNPVVQPFDIFEGLFETLLAEADDEDAVREQQQRQQPPATADRRFRRRLGGTRVRRTITAPAVVPRRSNIAG